MKKEILNNIAIYQSPTGAVEVRIDEQRETIMLTQQQVGDLFGVQKAAISKHVKNIFATKELEKDATVSILETVQKEGKREIKRQVEYYNLDLILSIGYRVNSANATKFRQWATKTLRQHIVKGYTLNKKRLRKNYDEFLQAVDAVKKLLPSSGLVKAEDALELVKMFASTWLSLDAYDKSRLPHTGITKKQVTITAEELTEALKKLKQELIRKGEASELFATDRGKDSIAGIVGSIFQTFGGGDMYPTVEEKAAHLLYFMVKNHPFTDGNKRSGAFAFVWFLHKMGLLQKDKMTPEALTALTLLVAESNPKDKDKMIGLILQLLKK
jgi:prophage maintenance system killer protein/predicted transcriptional regulator